MRIGSPLRSGDGVDPEHPWLGLQPFAEETQSYFFGRTGEVREMFLMVRDHSLTVLFSESGLGKTSLLRAGLIPKLRVEGYRPARVLLDFSNSGVVLVDQVRRAIATAVVGNEHGGSIDWLERWAPLASLWEIFAHLELRPSDLEAHPLVLIFDQFEEVFTLRGDEVRSNSQRTEQRAEVGELLHQLGDLVENRLPIALQESFQTDQSRVRLYDTRPRPPRVVLALREDYLSHLEAWKAVMPSLMRNRISLGLLTGPQALEAVIKPGRKGRHELVSKEVGEAIVRHVARRQDDVPIEQIEAVPPLVSLLCERLNSARLKAQQDQISAELVASQSADILQRFYDESFEEFPEAIRSTIRKFVEDELLTIGGRRKPIPHEDAVVSLAEKGMPEPSKIVDVLIGQRLLTSERRGGLPCIEITHDVLAPLVARSRDIRQKTEAREQEENRRLEAEARAADERRRSYRHALYEKRFVQRLGDETFWTELLDDIGASRVRIVLGAQVVTLAPDDRLLDSHAARELLPRLGD